MLSGHQDAPFRLRQQDWEGAAADRRSAAGAKALPHGFRPPYNAPMLSLVISTIAFFVAGYFIKRYLDEIGVPKTVARALVVFVLALAVAYGVAFIVDRAAGLAG
jgi:hypothetical protein